MRILLLIISAGVLLLALALFATLGVGAANLAPLPQVEAPAPTQVPPAAAPSRAAAPGIDALGTPPPPADAEAASLVPALLPRDDAGLADDPLWWQGCGAGLTSGDAAANLAAGNDAATVRADLWSAAREPAAPQYTRYVVWEALNIFGQLFVDPESILDRAECTYSYPCGGMPPNCNPVRKATLLGPYCTSAQTWAYLCSRITDRGSFAIWSPCSYWVVCHLSADNGPRVLTHMGHGFSPKVVQWAFTQSGPRVT